MDHNGNGIARSLNKEKCYIPKDLVESYDRNVLRLEYLKKMQNANHKLLKWIAILLVLFGLASFN